MNFLKDLGIGLAAIGGVLLIGQGVVYLPTLFGFEEKVGAYILAGAAFFYMCWIFGGLTRSIYLKGND